MQREGTKEGSILDGNDSAIAAVKAGYIQARKEVEQRYIVNVRNCSTRLVDLTSRTFRTTGCDVVSLVTTTVPMKNGTMKDIKMHNKEMRRCVSPLSLAANYFLRLSFISRPYSHTQLFFSSIPFF